MTIAQSILNDFPGRKLVDATKPLKVTVRKGDVDKADRKSPRSCALSWAVYRENEVEEVIVYKSVAYLVYSDRIVRYELNAGIQEEIVTFDRHGTFDLGDYRLKPPRPSLRLDAIRTSGTKRGPHSNLHPRPIRHKTVGIRVYE